MCPNKGLYIDQTASFVLGVPPTRAAISWCIPECCSRPSMRAGVREGKRCHSWGRLVAAGVSQAEKLTGLLMYFGRSSRKETPTSGYACMNELKHSGLKSIQLQALEPWRKEDSTRFEDCIMGRPL